MEESVDDQGIGADPEEFGAGPDAPVVTPEEDAPADGDQAPDAAVGGVPTSGTATAEGAWGGESVAAAAAADPELARLRTDLEERTADLQRVSAEYTNYRRRVERDREATVTGAKAQFANELLTVLDDVERASTHGDLTGPFKVVADRLTETLTRAGLTGFGEVGDVFDPSVHEAVAHQSSLQVSEPTVAAVMRRGYRFGDRVLRPALVVVTDRDTDDHAGSESESGFGSQRDPAPDHHLGTTPDQGGTRGGGPATDSGPGGRSDGRESPDRAQPDPSDP